VYQWHMCSVKYRHIAVIRRIRTCQEKKLN